MASRGGDAREGLEFVRWCEALRTEEPNEEGAAEAVSAAAEATAAVLQSGNWRLHDTSAGASSIEDVAADGFSAVFGGWLESCEICCQVAFGARAGAGIAANLGQRFPNILDQWLTTLKNLASAAVLATSTLRSQGRIPPAGLMLTLDSVWPELGGIGGLNASRWRGRVAAVELAVVLAVNEETVSNRSKSTTSGLGFQSETTELLKRLVIKAAAAASEVAQVRLSAINGARTIITSTFHHLSGELYCELVGALFATCMDPVPEVQKAGCESVMNLLQLSSPDGRQEVVLKLVDRFIKTSLLRPVATLGDKPTRDSSLDGLSRDAWLADSVTSVIDLLLLPGPPFFEWTKKNDNNMDRLPLLLVAAAAAFEKAEKLKNRESAAKLESLIMSMGKPLYQASLLAMLNPTLGAYSGASVASIYKDASVLDEDEAGLLHTISRVTVLKAVSSALHGATIGDGRVHSLLSYHDLLPITSARQELSEDLTLGTLRHIVEVIQIPPDLTKSVSTESSEIMAKEFLDCAQSVVHIAHFLLDSASGSRMLVADRGTLVQDLLLAFAALASGEGEKQVDVFWTSKALQKFAVQALSALSKVSEPDCPAKHEKRKAGTEDIGGVEGMILSLLPVMLPRIKETIKSSSTFGTEDSIYITSEGGDVSTSIVAAHQLAWCVMQVRYPHLGHHCHTVMPCALTALDHYSPVVKKQAMRVLIHLAENLNPSELQWYGDVTLDAVCRSLIGCGELWDIAIKMAVKLVTCIEGKNPRGSWYRRVLGEMLDELERHPDDQARQVAWLQTVIPQLEAMGLVLVTQFKQLLPLVYGWLQARDDILCILALGVLKVIVTRTWLRMPFHADRIWGELSAVYRDAHKRKLCTAIQAEVQEICRLLSLCCGQEFNAWEKSRDDPALGTLVQFLEQYSSRAQQSLARQTVDEP